MSTFSISVFDGILPMKISFDETPKDFNELFAEVARQFPEKSRKLIEQSFSDEDMQKYTILMNQKNVLKREQLIAPEDKIVILGDLSFG